MSSLRSPQNLLDFLFAHHMARHLDDVVRTMTTAREHVIDLHSTNVLLWDLEERARTPYGSDKDIADAKRRIDELNWFRNEIIESMDEFLGGVLCDSGCGELTTETPGSLIDRLSISRIRFEWTNQSLLSAGAPDVEELFLTRISIVTEQTHDLRRSLWRLLYQAYVGERRFKVYRQFKTGVSGAGIRENVARDVRMRAMADIATRKVLERITPRP